MSDYTKIPDLVPERDTVHAFIRWAASKPHLRAILETTALFGGIGCSVLHIHSAGAAVATYLLGYVLALVVMVPWADAERWFSGGWIR
jgi:hypothetical protein